VVVRRNPYNRCLTSSTNLKKQEKWISINQLGDTNHQQHPPNTGSNETTVQQPVPVQRVPIQSVPLLSVSDESQTVSHQNLDQKEESAPFIEPCSTSEEAFSVQAVEESPVIIQRQHNIQHNGLRKSSNTDLDIRKQVHFKGRRGSYRSVRRNSHRGAEELCLVKTRTRMSRTPSPPPIRSYQRDLLRHLAEVQEANNMSDQSQCQVPVLKNDVRMTREEKKNSGWQMPDSGANKSKLVRSLELFLVNLMRPVDMRNEVLLQSRRG